MSIHTEPQSPSFTSAKNLKPRSLVFILFSIREHSFHSPFNSADIEPIKYLLLDPLFNARKSTSTKKAQRMTSSVISCLSKLAKEEEAFDNIYKFGKGLFQFQRESLNLAIEKGKDMHEEDRLAYHAFYIDDCHSFIKNIQKLNTSISRAIEEIEIEMKTKRETEGEEFHDAAHNDDLANVKAIFKRGFADVNCLTIQGGFSSLMLASSRGNLDIVKFLVNEAKANVELLSKDGFSSLYLSSQEGQLEIVRFLVITAKANTDVETEDGFTALSIAIQQGFLEIVKVLVQRGNGKVDHQTKNGCTCLMLSCYYGHKDIASFLLSEGASHTFKNKYGKTAGDYALERHGWNLNAMIAEANICYFDHVFDCMISADYSPLIEKKKRGGKRKRGEEEIEAKKEEKEKEELSFLLRFMKKVYFSDFMMSKNVFPKLSFNPGAEAGEGKQFCDNITN